MIPAQQVSDWAARLLLTNPFPGKSQRELVQIIQACQLEVFSDGETILTEGESGGELYFLMEGEVTVLKRDTDGQDRELVVMTAPTMFGHMALVDGSARSASCRARGRVTVAKMTRALYQDLLAKPHPIGTTFRRLMLATLTRQLVDGNARLFGLIGGQLPVTKKQVKKAAKRPTSTSSRSKPSTPPAKPSATKKPAQSGAEDVSRSDLLEMAGILNGWKVDTSGLEDIEFVETEADRRRSGKPTN